MWTYGFFNSVNGDRTYNAEQMSSIFEGLITNGVYESVGNKMAVQPVSGLTIQIATGRGWFSRHWVNNDSPYSIVLAKPDVILNRYAAICVKVDDNEGVRSAAPYVKYSDFATSPQKPAMTRSEKVNEYCLAYVYLKAGATEIKASDIEDTRQNTNLCGWVTGLLKQIDSNTLYTQFTAQFNEWFESIRGLIDDDVATMLVDALPTGMTLTLPAASWSNKQQTVTVLNMNTTKSVIVQGTTETQAAFSAAGIKCTGQSRDSLTFTCDTVPTVNIKVDILHMGR